MNIFGYQIDLRTALSIIGTILTIVFGIIALFGWLSRRREIRDRDLQTIIDDSKGTDKDIVSAFSTSSYVLYDMLRIGKRHSNRGVKAFIRRNLSLLLAIIALLVTLFAWRFPARSELPEETKAKIEIIEKKLENLENTLGKQPYIDGLAKSPPPVFDPFAEGLDLMTQSKWDEAIAEFKESMKEAKGSQIVALYNLIGICYYTPGKHDSAMFANNKSLELARELGDKGGQGGVNPFCWTG